METGLNIASKIYWCDFNNYSKRNYLDKIRNQPRGYLAYLFIYRLN